MANMSYCRFYNTELDMSDCIEALRCEETLSREELAACKCMFQEIVQYLDEEGVEVDYDGFSDFLTNLSERNGG